MPTNLMTL